MNIRTALEKIGLANLGTIHHNLNAPRLYEHAVFLGEGIVSEHGALVVKTAPHTGRIAQDKFIVEEPNTKTSVRWGAINQPFDPKKFDVLKARMMAYLQSRDVYAQDCYAGSSPKYRIHTRVVSELAWHSLFTRNTFVLPDAADERFDVQFTVIVAPNFKAIPAVDGTRSEAFVVINFAQGLVLIGGTRYAGEIKKAMVTVMSQLMPYKKVLPVHCAVSVGKQGDSALLFGLPGTGKTTHSTMPERRLVGDDEHGWADEGVFNFDGGCYAKTTGVTPESEPAIFQMTRTFGTILENVSIDTESRSIKLSDAEANTGDSPRAAYSRDSLKIMGDIIVPSNKALHPKHAIFLTSDAFGVLPPIARLTPEQAAFFFLAGYTSLMSEGEKEPSAMFSACFGEPFITQPAPVYAKFFSERLRKNKTQTWLVNTGWTGGSQRADNSAKGGSRISLEHTRVLLKAAINGELDKTEFLTEPFFNLALPKNCPGVPAEMLNPRNVWKNIKEYDEQARTLHTLFTENFAAKFAGALEPAIETAIAASIAGAAITSKSAAGKQAQGKQDKQAQSKQTQDKQIPESDAGERFSDERDAGRLDNRQSRDPRRGGKNRRDKYPQADPAFMADTAEPSEFAAPNAEESLSPELSQGAAHEQGGKTTSKQAARLNAKQGIKAEAKQRPQKAQNKKQAQAHEADETLFAEPLMIDADAMDEGYNEGNDEGNNETPPAQKNKPQKRGGHGGGRSAQWNNRQRPKRTGNQ